MDVELAEIRDFLGNHPPFDQLPGEALDKLPKALSIRYFRRGLEFPPGDAGQSFLYLIRQGAVEMRNTEGDLVSKLGEGDMCTFPCGPGSAPFDGTTVEDTLSYLLPCDELHKIKEEHAAFREHFDHSVSERLRRALRHLKEPPGQANNLMTMDTGELTDHTVVSCTPDCSIQSVAQLMTDKRVSSILVMEEGRLLGMVTLRDLRTRCLAVGLPYDRPIGGIMTERLKTIDHNAPAFQALLASAPKRAATSGCAASSRSVASAA